MKKEAPPTVRQIYALAAALCDKTGEEFPQDRGEASAMLDRLKGKLPGRAGADVVDPEAATRR